MLSLEECQLQWVKTAADIACLVHGDSRARLIYRSNKKKPLVDLVVFVKPQGCRVDGHVETAVDLRKRGVK